MGGLDRHETGIVGGDQEEADREELAGGGTKTTGAEENDMEVPISEVAPRPDPGLGGGITVATDLHLGA